MSDKDAARPRPEGAVQYESTVAGCLPWILVILSVAVVAVGLIVVFGVFKQ